MKRDETQRRYNFIKYVGITALALLMLVSIAGAAPFAYVTNINSNTVSVIDTPENTVIKTINVGYGPQRIAITPDGSKAYVVNSGNGVYQDSTVSVIDTAINAITATVNVGSRPTGIAVTPDGKKVYVSNYDSSTISVIDTATNTIAKTVDAGSHPAGIAVTPDGKRVYVANYYDHGSVSIIDTATDIVTATVKVKLGPSGVAVTPDGTKVYVTYSGINSVSVIDTATNAVNTLMLYGTASSVAVAITPDGKKVYVPNSNSNTVFLFDTATVIETVTETVTVGVQPAGVSVSPDGSKVYVTNSHSNNVSVIDTATNTVTASVNVGQFPYGIAITPLQKLIPPVANFSSNVTQGYAPLLVQFTDLSINSTSRNWDFDNNGILDSTEENPVYVYQNPGSYIANLTVSNENGTDSKTATINVLPAPLKTPTITWNTPADITIGTALSSTQLNAVAKDPVTGNTIAGTYDYTPATETVLNAGNSQNLHVDFTPEDTTNYNIVSKDVTINVLKVTPTITWSNPVDITYGTALNDTQFNAVASVPGTFVYTPAEGAVLSAGTQTLHVDFTPSDTTNYNSVSQTVTINVLKATPTITWSNPADIIAGTKLSNIELSASASVPGSFVYTPPAGTILSIGTQTLHVDFTPTDSINYTSASKEVTVNVLSIPAPNINSVTVPLAPVPVGTSITASADVTYLGDLSILTAEWNWGDGSTSKPEGSSNFAASHVYNSAGLYTITFTLKDKNGGIYTQTSPNCVVVYDPQGGFVTGGGWINSPAGAYVPDNTLAGKATFGFVSKYEKGATVPTGKTEFQFKVANLNFHSVNYDWLIVAGSHAKYKGTGTINEGGNYGFMLNAIDGAIKGDNIDKFRIKIWDKENGNTIYDNEIGTGEDAEPSTAVGGGSIIIHKEK